MKPNSLKYKNVSSSKQTLEHQRFEIENFALKEGIKIDTRVKEKILYIDEDGNKQFLGGKKKRMLS